MHTTVTLTITNLGTNVMTVTMTGNGQGSLVTMTKIVITMAGTKKINISCEVFNCHGLKQSIDYINSRLENCDILCLNETWLRPYECDTIKRMILDDSVLVFAKSSMCDIESGYSGRPFGGIAIICKRNSNFIARNISVHSDRIIVIGLHDPSGVLFHVIACVYMPFYDRSNYVNTSQYVEVIDELQNIVDKYSAQVPIKILGDFNAQLPVASKLQNNWYRTRGFNSHSALLYDFLVSNNLLAADLLFKQKQNYTFSCIARNVYTWIDHVCCSKADINDVKTCVIVEPEALNVSDHLPLHIDFTAVIDTLSPTNNDFYAHVYPDWSCQEKNLNYCNFLAAKLEGLELLPPTPTDVASAINTRFSTIVNAIHSASKEAGCIPKKVFKPKPYWCPELSKIRDKKRFWWTLWVAMDRPRQGTVFEVYKNVKKLFRCLCRRYMNNNVLRDLNVLNHLYNKNNMKGFWNKLKRQQQSSVKSSLSAEDFGIYYRGIMSQHVVRSPHTDYIEHFVTEKVNNFEFNGITGHCKYLLNYLIV